MANTYKNFKIICTICARGGSKRIHKKNIKNLGKHPLIYYTIKIAKECDYIDDIIVSTDDDEIKKVVEKYGVKAPFKRPGELATDKISKIPVIKHAVDWAEKNWKKKHDIVVDLSVASPLRSVDDVKRAIELLVKEKASNVFSVTSAYRNPYFNMVEIENGKVKLVKPPQKQYAAGQDAPIVYDMNDSIYAWWKDELMKSETVFNDKTKIYLMPKERSLDIDDEFDFLLVKFLINKRK